MFVDLTLAGAQLLLLYLKLTEQLDKSWWLVMLPSIIWAVVGIILSAGRKKKIE